MLVTRWTTEIAITDRRVIHKWGWIKRGTEELNLSKVESVELHQSIIGRLLGFGKVVSAGTGIGLIETPPIDEPIAFKKALEEQHHKIGSS